MSGLQLGRAALRENLGSTFVQRGDALRRAGHVREARIAKDGAIVGEVMSSDYRHLYRQRIFVDGGDGVVAVDGECSCPMGGDCKHVAAVLLALIDRHGPLPLAFAPAAVDPQALRVLRAGPVAEAWIENLERRLPPAGAGAAPAQKRLLYSLHVAGPHPQLHLYTVPLRKAGSWGRPEPYRRAPREVLGGQPPRFVDDIDLDLLARLAPLYTDYNGIHLSGRGAAPALQAVAQSGRLWLAEPREDAAPLRWGGVRPGRLGWVADKTGRRALRLLAAEGDARIVSGTPAWWLDAGEVGSVDLGLPVSVAEALLSGPPLTEEEQQVLAPRLQALGSRLPAPLPQLEGLRREEVRGVAPRPQLHLRAQAEPGAKRGEHRRVAVALLSVDYAGTRFDAPLDDAPPTVVLAQGERLLAVERDPAAERALEEELERAGLYGRPAGDAFGYGALLRGLGLSWRFVADDEQVWPELLNTHLQRWSEQGWEVRIDADFPHAVQAASGWSAQLDEDPGNGWFEIGVEVEVDGRRVALAPLLAGALESMSCKAIEERAAQGKELILPWPDDAAPRAAAPQRWLALPAARLAPLLRLLDLWFDGGLRRGEPKARLSAFDLGALDALDELGIACRGAERLRALARDLKGLAGIAPVPPPRGLAAQLRPYQAQGLAWLDFLRQHRLAGILADDMGLGKTLQTLALLLREKEEGRLTAPALVVAPTSLVRNWQDEAARFAPALRVLAWHGLQRKTRVDELGKHDLVLTSYALLPRDVKTLADTEWHYVVLDESQRIKNARSQAAQALGLLRARHRLCLSGTPLENHLGELWSQMNFLLPGLLGDAERFRRQWRTPIEKGGDTERARLLAARVRPFMLRRSKAQVAAELPPKTETVLKVELEGAQRDLYETVRAAMDKRVRDAIARRGLAQSQVVVLDALLKMRQVCCDPLLLPEKARAGFAKAASAKRKLLAELLPDLIEDGRRVLVFSSFASMLELIENDLRAAGTPYGKLTGASTDRAEQVAEFQSGAKPVFLISLKAGGVGLNLTAADAVIVYDPWWNPAAEQQAIDRAHRIGQDKPVFVYKLIAAGTVEERILDLQARKADLAARLLEGAATDLALTEADFAALFAPTGEA